MPVRRSASARALAASTAIAVPRPSSTTKSLPRPCILRNGILPIGAAYMAAHIVLSNAGQLPPKCRPPQGRPGKIGGWFVPSVFAANFGSESPLPGLVPGIHVSSQPGSPHRRRGWPDQVLPRGSSLVAQDFVTSQPLSIPGQPCCRREPVPLVARDCSEKAV